MNQFKYFNNTITITIITTTTTTSIYFEINVPIINYIYGIRIQFYFKCFECNNINPIALSFLLALVVVVALRVPICGILFNLDSMSKLLDKWNPFSLLIQYN